MIAGWSLLLLLAAPAPQPVQVLTLKDPPRIVRTSPTGSPRYILAGERIAGTLLGLSGDGVRLKTDAGEVTIPSRDILEVSFPKPATPPAVKPVAAWLRLVDGTRVRAARVALGPKRASFETIHFGTVSLPPETVAAVRFGQLEPEVAKTWESLLVRKTKTDRLVVRKDDVLDHLDGVIAEIDGDVVRFLLDGDELSFKRDKVFGLIYFRKPVLPSRPACRAEFAGGDSVLLATVARVEGAWRARMLAGAEISLPMAALRRLDFGASRLVYLSRLEPRDVKYTPFFDVTWRYRRDRNLDGGPLRLDGKVFDRGLALHSKTRLVYRLADGYRRFQAVMGIDQLVGRRGNVHVIISGDGRKLLEADVRGIDKPRIVDLDVAGVAELEILVDFGGDLDVADHLDLADARLLR